MVEREYPNTERLVAEFDRKASAHNRHGMFIHLADANGKLFLSNSHAPLTGMKFILISDDRDVLVHTRPNVPFGEGTDDVRTAITAVDFKDGTRLWLRIGTSLRMINETVSSLTRSMLVVGGIMLLFGPIIGYLMARRATQPIADINRVVPRLEPRKLKDRLPLRGTGDELDVLSAQINDLLDRIAAYVERNQVFTANAAHELRSPLAAIQSSVEVALNEERNVEEYQELLETVVNECMQLRTLVNQLLQLAENDGEAAKINYVAVPISQIIQRSVAMFRDTAEDRGIQLLTPRLDDCYVRGDPKRLRQVVNNLLDNGIKFNRPGGNVSVVVLAQPADGTVLIRFTDTGAGIPEDDIPYLFDRFYRGDKAHSREMPQGTGLGLSICMSVIQAHQGQIQVRSALDTGTTFEVILPVSPAPIEEPVPVVKEIV
ncbi:MAG: HAMP domain-containing sensor histidine kinase [Pirellulales bacterium]